MLLTSENCVDISKNISTRPWTNHTVTLTQTSCGLVKSNMADASSAILFIIELRRASMENWVKYAILRVRMSLSLGFRFQVVGEMQESTLRITIPPATQAMKQIKVTYLSVNLWPNASHSFSINTCAQTIRTQQLEWLKGTNNGVVLLESLVNIWHEKLPYQR